MKLGERDVMKPLDSAALSSSLSTSLSVVLMPGLGPGASLPATATVRLGTRAGLAPEHDAVGSHTHSADQGAGHTNGGARGARGGDVGVDDGGAGVNAA